MSSAVNSIGGGALGSLVGGVALGGAGSIAGGLAGGSLGLSGVTDGITHAVNQIGDPFNAKMPGSNLIMPTNGMQVQQAADQQQNALKQQQDFVAALQAQNGIANQSNVYNQLQGVANGTGPNPAQAQLAQSTGANVANQAALMAGQRGSSANPALVARQAAMQGANIQQQAAGQGAALQAQQSLGAINQMGGVAGQQVSNLANANNSQANSALQGQQNILGAAQGYNNAQTNLANTSAQIESSNAKNRTGMITGVLGAAGQALGLAKAEGGLIEGAAPRTGPRSYVAKHFSGAHIPMAEGGKVPVILSPGERVLSPDAAAKAAEGKANPMAAGQKVPGKAVVAGAKNDYANDIVPAEAEEGAIVLPRSITQLPAKQAERKAVAFIRAKMAEQKSKKG